MIDTTHSKNTLGSEWRGAVERDKLHPPRILVRDFEEAPFISTIVSHTQATICQNRPWSTSVTVVAIVIIELRMPHQLSCWLTDNRRRWNAFKYTDGPFESGPMVVFQRNGWYLSTDGCRQALNFFVPPPEHGVAYLCYVAVKHFPSYRNVDWRMKQRRDVF